nr:MAG TPA: hypothetical protein [Caudoviricetes sp.]
MADGCIIGLGTRKLTTVHLSPCVFGPAFHHSASHRKRPFRIELYDSM